MNRAAGSGEVRAKSVSTSHPSEAVLPGVGVVITTEAERKKLRFSDVVTENDSDGRHRPGEMQRAG
jgi:hypothetical protein